jgi:hypothetical protein
MALASSSRAADADAAFQSASPVEELRGGVSRPEDFQRFVEGSRARRGDIDAPRADARRDGLGPGIRPSLNRTQAAPRRAASIPPAPAAGGREAPLDRFTPAADLTTRGLTAVFGLGLLLVAAGMLGTTIESSPKPEPLVEVPPSLPGPIALRTPEPPPARYASAPADSHFIDTRMPVRTWRAITWPEQRLIERWDSSREKSLGLASLSEWLDAKGNGEGVDIPALKAKLSRA